MTTVRGATIAAFGRGLLIIGPAGSGKSSLALDLIAHGAVLIADDVTELARRGDALIATCPLAGRGLIEARGIGILRMPTAPSAPLAMVVDLGRRGDERLPKAETWDFDGVGVRLLKRSAQMRPAAIYLALQTGGPLDPDAPLPLAEQRLSAQSCAAGGESARGRG